MLSTSPWYGDSLYLPSSSSLFSSEFDVATIPNETESFRLEAEDADTFSVRVSAPGFSVESSLAGSDCASEDLYSDVTSIHSDFYNSLLPLTESLTSPLLCMLDEPTDASANRDSGSLCWSDSELNNVRGGDGLCLQDDLHTTDTGSSQVIPSVTSSPRLSVKHKRKRSRSSQSKGQDTDQRDTQKPWHSLSSSERLSLVQELTETVSHSLGLREQLEVIRLINPQAEVRPLDTEFVIDLDSLDDKKLQAVRDYICVQRIGDQSECLKEGHVISDSCSECSASSSPSEEKKMSKKQRQQLARRERQRQRKEERQQEKEVRSGLFKKEQVLSLSTSRPEQSAEVDILT